MLQAAQYSTQEVVSFFSIACHLKQNGSTTPQKPNSMYEQWCQPALNVQSLISTLALLKEDSGPVGESTQSNVWSMYSSHPTAPVPPQGREFLLPPYVSRTKFFDAAVITRGNRRSGVNLGPRDPSLDSTESVWNCAKELEGGS